MSKLTPNSSDTTDVKLSTTDIKNRTQLMKEVQLFAVTLHQAAEADDSDTLTLTFFRDDARALALTLHQLLWVFKHTEKN